MDVTATNHQGAMEIFWLTLSISISSYVRGWYLLLFPLTGLAQNSNPETSERSRSSRLTVIGDINRLQNIISNRSHGPERSMGCIGWTKSGFLISNHSSSSARKLMMFS